MMISSAHYEHTAAGSDPCRDFIDNSISRFCFLIDFAK